MGLKSSIFRRSFPKMKTTPLRNVHLVLYFLYYELNNNNYHLVLSFGFVMVHHHTELHKIWKEHQSCQFLLPGSPFFSCLSQTQEKKSNMTEVETQAQGGHFKALLTFLSFSFLFKKNIITSSYLHVIICLQFI